LNTPVLIAIAGFAGAIVSAIVAIYVAKRQHSGRIETTEAEKLWDEGAAMRKELRDEVLFVRAENLSLRTQQQSMQYELGELKQKTITLEAEISALKAALAILKASDVELRGVVLRLEKPE
jgi:chromosome segregation ATPase